MKIAQNVLLFRCVKKDATPQQPRPVPRRFRTYLLPDDFLSSRNLRFGDEVRITCGVVIEQGQLAALETNDHLVFIGYIKVNEDESADLYGPDDFEPYLSCKKGEYEIIGPVNRVVISLAEMETQLEGKSRLAILRQHSRASFGD
jgi:hypothetical protein